MLEFLVPFIQLTLVPAVAGWIVSRLRKPKDWERAAEIQVIARAAAALLVIQYPDKPASELIAKVVEQIISRIPTSNPDVAKRAAAEAVKYTLGY